MMYEYNGPLKQRTACARPAKRLRGDAYMRPINLAALKSGRENAGYSQRELAALCRCTQAAISALETGAMTQCSEDLAKQISKWLREDVGALFTRSADTRTTRTTNAAGTRRTLTHSGQGP